jgi:hypothetical protein
MVAVLGGSILGFGLGFFGFKVKNRWCPACGATTSTLQQRRYQAGAQSR